MSETTMMKVSNDHTYNDISIDLMSRIDRLEEKNETITKKLGVMTDDMNNNSNHIERLSSQVSTLNKLVQLQWFVIFALMVVSLILALT